MPFLAVVSERLPGKPVVADGWLIYEQERNLEKTFSFGYKNFHSLPVREAWAVELTCVKTDT